MGERLFILSEYILCVIDKKGLSAVESPFLVSFGLLSYKKLSELNFIEDIYLAVAIEVKLLCCFLTAER